MNYEPVDRPEGSIQMMLAHIATAWQNAAAAVERFGKAFEQMGQAAADGVAAARQKAEQQAREEQDQANTSLQ